jgi:hypothetical protein
LANDSDPDGWLVPSSVSIVSFPNKGTVQVLPSGVIRYNAPWLLLGGSTSLRYQVCDDRAGCAQANVTIQIALSLF